MTDQNRLDPIVEKLDLLLRRHASFTEEVQQLRSEISALKNLEEPPAAMAKPPITSDDPVPAPEDVEVAFPGITPEPRSSGKMAKQPVQRTKPKRLSKKISLDYEKFIGENLINKIGILITILGVGIGAKYAIDQGYIGPLTRIVFGYLIGLGLMGTAMILKKNYLNFSAVLLSGALAITYFITYFAYSYYQLIPQGISFALMTLFTGFAVLAAISYNKQIIAHLGLVGAYAVPFLLSNDSGQITILFTYMAIINVGILAISVKKYWKPLVYSSFGLTWLIYGEWLISSYQQSTHFTLALAVVGVFFITFYGTILAYKLVRKEKYQVDDIALLLINSFVFFGVGYALVADHVVGGDYLGLFTLLNGVIHFIVSVIIYRQKLADRVLFYLVSGLVLVFITIAIPIQLDGNWVTLIWAGEAALMFWIGRSKQTPIYEKFAYVLIALAMISVLDDWNRLYHNYYANGSVAKLKPLLNVNFLSSLLVLGAFGFINWVYQRSQAVLSSLDRNRTRILDIVLPALFLITLYGTFHTEISNYWHQVFQDSMVQFAGDLNYSYQYNYDLVRFKNIWILNYSIFFLIVCAYVNLRKVRSSLFGYINLGLNLIAVAAFLNGLYTLGELRDSYLDTELAAYFDISIWNLIIRYISFGFIAGLLWTTFRYIKSDLFQEKFKKAFDVLLFGSIIWVASAELIHWMELAESTQSYKLGLSILWGFYSLLLIALGIWKKRQHLRIGAISLFGFTLIKLFFYDISHLDTLAKTIVFVSLGILLLIISFLYHKFKHLITDESESD